ncbi:MAG: hypothetical protein ACM3ST_00745 [Bdellovibrio bacteriovorus]
MPLDPRRPPRDLDVLRPGLMRQGYLLIETHPNVPGRIRLSTSDRLPGAPQDLAASEPPARPQTRYVALFTDLAVASMHAHSALRRDLVDIDSRLYRTDPVKAVAALESIALSHRRIYLDPELAADPRLDAEIARRRARQRRRDQVWNGIGILAVLLLLLKLLLGI